MEVELLLGQFGISSMSRRLCPFIPVIAYVSQQ